MENESKSNGITSASHQVVDKEIDLSCVVFSQMPLTWDVLPLRVVSNLDTPCHVRSIGVRGQLSV